MTETFAPDAEVVLNMTDKSVPAVVVKDDGTETVVVRFDHPTLEGQTTAVPVLREFVVAAGATAPAPSVEPVEVEEVVLHGEDLSAG